jgi:hypothetical protein
MEPDFPPSVIEDFYTTGQRGHLAEEGGICPKKDDVAMWAAISLGYDSPHTLTGQLSRNLTVRYSGREDEMDGKLFR